MRFLFILPIIFFIWTSSVVHAQNLIKPSEKPEGPFNSPNLIPAEKPSGGRFMQRSQNLISAYDFQGVRPPRLPSQKASLSNNDEFIPIPTSKPFTLPKIAGETFKSEAEKDDEVTISFSDYDDRTAGHQGLRNSMERVRRSRIQETDEKSPFKTASLPRAGKKGSNDPTIVFFKENSSDLEVGQMAIIEGEILRTLKRNSRKNVMIYGFAERNKGKIRAEQLSLNRAMLIAQYLSDNGVRDNRIMLRAMGSDTSIAFKDRVDVVIE